MKSVICFCQKPIFEPVIEEAPGPLRHCFHCYCGEFCSGRGRLGGIQWTSAAAERPGRPAWPIGSPFVERVTERATRIEAVGTAHAEYDMKSWSLGLLAVTTAVWAVSADNPTFPEDESEEGALTLSQVAAALREGRGGRRALLSRRVHCSFLEIIDFLSRCRAPIFVFPGPFLNRPLARLVSWTGTFIVSDKLPGRILRETISRFHFLRWSNS